MFLTKDSDLLLLSLAEMWTNYTFAGPGKVGGSSWTPNWLTFDNSIYRVHYLACF